MAPRLPWAKAKAPPPNDRTAARNRVVTHLLMHSSLSFPSPHRREKTALQQNGERRSLVGGPARPRRVRDWHSNPPCPLCTPSSGRCQDEIRRNPFRRQMPFGEKVAPLPHSKVDCARSYVQSGPMTV